MAAVVEAILVAVEAAAVAAEFPFCTAAAAAAVGTELAYAAAAPDVEVRSALELYDGDGNIVG